LPIRIYALAKQLKLNNKTLVDICKSAGVTGKGSALASLSEEEVEKVKAHISGGGKTAAPSAPASTAPPAPERPTTLRREDYIGPGGVEGKVPVLPTSRMKPRQEEEPAQPVAEPPAADLPEEIIAPVETPSTTDSTAPVAQEPPAPTLPEAPPKKPAPPRHGEDGPHDQTGAYTRLPSPTKKSKTREPAAQKPDMRLPVDAIRAGSLRRQTARQYRGAGTKTQSGKEETGHGEGYPFHGNSGVDVAFLGPRTAWARAWRCSRYGRPGYRDTRWARTTSAETKKSSSRRRKSSDDEETTKTPRRMIKRIRRIGTNTAAPRKHNVVLEIPCTVRTFSEAVGVPASQVLGKLLTMGAGMGVNINAELDLETAELLAVEFGVEIDFRRPVTLEQQVLTAVEQEEEDPAMLKPRPPVITFLGHVDHGKTSLLDRIIGIDVVSAEKGGITQHIRAYQIEKDGHPISFVDTPGHEAFTEMRARGANVTDIAVLVVAADDGVMPQTEEAISHARAAGVPIVVALNKIDLPGVNPQRAYEQLAANELLPSEWGGDIEVIKTSATTGEGVGELLDTLLTVAELHEYKANPDRPACGTCLESSLHEGLGVVAKVLVERGTLRVGDVVVCGAAYGRVKAMYDTLLPEARHEEAGPSMPVNLTGFDEAPGAGDRFHVVPEIAQARQIAEQRAAETRQQSLSGGPVHVTLENLFERLGQEEVQTLNIILRADVRGSIEAIRKELTKLEHPEVQLRVLQATVGGITEADVHLADASDAVIIGFNVKTDPKAHTLAQRANVDIKNYNIIYEAVEDVKSALSGLLKPELVEKVHGQAEVRQTFRVSKAGTVARLLHRPGHRGPDRTGPGVKRDGETVFEGRIGSLEAVQGGRAGGGAGLRVRHWSGGTRRRPHPATSSRPSPIEEVARRILAAAGPGRGGLMFVGVYRIELDVPASRSLKAKRSGAERDQDAARQAQPFGGGGRRAGYLAAGDPSGRRGGGAARLSRRSGRHHRDGGPAGAAGHPAPHRAGREAGPPLNPGPPRASGRCRKTSV